MTEDHIRKKDARPPGTSLKILLTGILLGITMAMLDGVAGALLDPTPFSTFFYLLLPMCLTATVFIVTYLLLWLAVFSHVVRILGLPVLPVALSLATFLGINFILTVPYGWLVVGYLSGDYLSEFFLFVLISLFASVVIYLVAQKAESESEILRLPVIMIMLLLAILFMAVIFGWIFRYELELFILSPSLKVSVIFLSIVIVGTAFTTIVRSKIKAANLLAVSISLMLISPFISMTTAKFLADQAKKTTRTDHRVKHVILLIIDTLRADSVYPTDQNNLLTPNIDELAQEGYLFTRAYSPAPWTLPAVASILTGLPVSVHLASKSASMLPDSLPTLAEYMRDAGYLTFGVVFNKWLAPRFNLSKGFMEYNFFPKNHNSFGLSVLKQISPEQKLYPYKTAKEITDLAIRRIKAHRHEDFFLYLHYFDPHRPYKPPDEFIPDIQEGTSLDKELLNPTVGDLRNGTFVPTKEQREMIKILYNGEVQYIDDSLGHLMDYFKELDLYDDSLIILTSDHGEEFWEHGGVDHGHTLYDEVLRVPLIIKLPGKWPGKVLNPVVSLEGIMPTVLEACGIAGGADYFPQGSYSSFLESSLHRQSEKPVVSTGQLFFEDRESVVFDGRKFIRHFITGREELFDLAIDPDEKESLISSSPDLVIVAEQILEEHKQESERLRERFGVTGSEEAELDSSTLEHLKSLGYVN
jgi:arylsulfatase A-like enzyme